MWLSIMVGAILGFLTGLGVGGGSLLILWLTMVIGMTPQTAKGINLLFFLPSAAIACFFRCRQGALRLKILLPAILAGCAAAGISSWVSMTLDVSLLKKLFGFLLLFTGIRELLWKPK